MKPVSVADIEGQIERLLTKYDSLTRPDMLLELKGYDENMVAAAIDNLVKDNRISVEEVNEGVKVYKKTSGFLRTVQHYSTSSSF